MTRSRAIAIDIGTTRLNASACPATYAAARTSRIRSVAYAVDESASDAKIASAVFFVSRSCVKRAVLIGLPTSRRFREAIVYLSSGPLLAALKMPQRGSRKGQLWRKTQ